MPRRPIQLILDFDGTLTRKDTLHLVAEAGYQRQKLDSNKDSLPPWKDIVDAYLSHYRAHTTEFNHGKPARRSLLEEVVWLNSLQHVERESAGRVAKAGIFDGVTRRDMELAATNAVHSSNVELRPGWADLLTTTYDHNLAVTAEPKRLSLLQVVSVNWSRWFIWAVLRHSCNILADQALAERVKQSLSTTSIYANEIESIAADPNPLEGPQGESMALRTAGDKLRQSHLDTAAPVDQTDPLRVYVGDSVTDLQCLVMADVGICVQDDDVSSGQKELVSTCERIGIDVKSLDRYQPIEQRASTLQRLQESMPNHPRCLYFVRDFYEIVDWIKSNA